MSLTRRRLRRRRMMMGTVLELVQTFEPLLQAAILVDSEVESKKICERHSRVHCR